MNKIRLKYIAGFAIGALLFGCNDSESDLLETKVYFEENSVTIIDKKPKIKMKKKCGHLRLKSLHHKSKV